MKTETDNASRSIYNKMEKPVRYLKCCLRDMIQFSRLYYMVYLIVIVVEMATSIAIPLVIANIFELVSDMDTIQTQRFWFQIFLLSALIGLPQMSSVVDRWMLTYSHARKEQYFGWKMFHHASHISLEEMEKPGVLDTFQKAEAAYSDYEALTEFPLMLMDVLNHVVTCIGCMVVLAKFSLFLLPSAIFSFIPRFVMTLHRQGKERDITRAQAPLHRRIHYLWRLFCDKASVKEMRVMGFSSYLKEKWTEANVQVVEELVKVRRKDRQLAVIGVAVKNIGFAVNILISLVLLLHGDIAIGVFAACFSAINTLESRQLSLFSEIPTVLQMYYRVEEYYDFFELKSQPEGEESYRPFEREIRLQGVHFQYPGAKTEALKGVDLTIRKGEHVVIVGENGSGKTTLSKVISGVFKPSSGSVSYDEQDVETLRRKELYRDISIVPQDFVHYHFTMRENICISDLAAISDEKRLARVIENAGMQELIESIGGVDVQMGREFGGRELSGGEWQKTAIARGLFKDCPLIILDEPTSALDPLVESEILTRFLELTRERTAIIISHRVGICRTADRIVVMKDGRAVETGTHEELLAAQGDYAKIWREQAKWYQA